MSVNSDSGSDDVRQTTIANGDEDVCRDFLRNVCRRGKRCKYRHPSGESGIDMGATSKPEPTFCHDFQNTGCHRPTCKFLHCTREEEEHYHQTGQLPQRLQQQQQQQQPAQPGMGGANCGGHNTGHSEIPVCRDYMKGECKRGVKCKYRHLGNNDYDCDVSRADSHQPPPPHRSDMRQHPSDLRNNHNHNYNSYDDGYDKFERYEYGQGHGPCHDGPPGALKRRRMDMDGYGGGGGGGAYESRFGPGLGGARPVSYQYQVLEEENAALRRRVEELKKQVADLTATNEVLLEQNARLRVSKTTTVNTVQVPVSQTLSPTVTLGLTGMGQAAALQAQAATLGAHLNSSLTQQIALNSDMATQHALQSAAQRMAREIHQQQQQQVAAAAAAVAATTPSRPQPGAPPNLGAPTMNPPLASLSLPQNNMVTVSLPSLVSQVPGASMSQNLGTPSNPLVSYPIMSQDMRCAVVPSSMAH